MVRQEILRVVSPSEQLELIQDITNHRLYEDFYQEFFPTCSDQVMLSHLDATIPSGFWNQVSPDYFRLLTLLSLQGAQYGFSSLDGHFYRHRSKNWVNHPLHPYHILATTVYLARLNDQTFKVKQKYCEELKMNGVAGAVGIWGHDFKVQRGRAHELPENVHVAKCLAEERMRNLRPICVTDYVIANRLKVIPITHEQADSINTVTFDEAVYPMVKERIGHLIDVEMALHNFLRPRRLWWQREHAWRRFEEVV